MTEVVSPRSATASAPSSPRWDLPNLAHPVEEESWRERFFAALPLFTVGTLCVVVAVYLYTMGAVTAVGGAGSARLRPWILFIALGITGISAGIVALLAEGAFAAPVETTHVPAAPSVRPSAQTRGRSLLGRSHGRHPGPTPEKRPSLMGGRTSESQTPAGSTAMTSSPPLAQSPATAQVWDESPVASGTRIPLPKEAWDESPEAFAAAASPSAPPEVILHQVDELEISLRKKPAPARSD
jgi:hypothetical protein